MSLSDQFVNARGAGRDFASTHWSVVLLAGQAHSAQSAAALEKLCQAYWYPLYSFTRRQGYTPHEAAECRFFRLTKKRRKAVTNRDPADDLTPDKIFERRWAETILSRALDRLREECDGAEKTRRFDEMKKFLLGEKDAGSLSEAAARLNLSLAAVKGLVHRLRRRFRELIRDEIAQTVAGPEEIDQEIRDLFAAFGN